MRLVLDTNVLFAAYISRGTCAALYEQVLAGETLITSGPDQCAGCPASDFPSRVCRDIDDDAILGTAVAAGADLIVSGDLDLLVLRQYHGIPVITPAEALARLHA